MIIIISITDNYVCFLLLLLLLIIIIIIIITLLLLIIILIVFIAATHVPIRGMGIQTAENFSASRPTVGHHHDDNDDNDDVIFISHPHMIIIYSYHVQVQRTQPNAQRREQLLQGQGEVCLVN